MKKVVWAIKVDEEDRDFIQSTAKEHHLSMTDFMGKLIGAIRTGKIHYYKEAFLCESDKKDADRYIAEKEKEIQWHFEEAGERIRKYDDLKAENDSLRAKIEGIYNIEETHSEEVKEEVKNFPENKKDIDLTQLYKIAEKRQITAQSVLDRALKMYR